MSKALEPVLAEYRSKGALFWGGWLSQDVGHDEGGQEVLAMPMLGRRRPPPLLLADGDRRKGPVKLKPVGLESGWVADNTTWKSGLDGHHPRQGRS